MGMRLRREEPKMTMRETSGKGRDGEGVPAIGNALDLNEVGEAARGEFGVVLDLRHVKLFHQRQP